MGDLINKVSDPLKVRDTLDYIAADNCLNIYLHVYV